jgi:hypothetical protein
MQIYQYRKPLSELERAFELYFGCRAYMEDEMKRHHLLKKPSADRLFHLRKELANAEKTIVSMFLEAVNSHDGQKIIEIASAVWFFRDHKAGQIPLLVVDSWQNLQIIKEHIEWKKKRR